MIKQQHELDNRKYNKIHLTEILLKKQTENAIIDFWILVIHTPYHGFGHQSMLGVIQYLFMTYRIIRSDDNKIQHRAHVLPHQPAQSHCGFLQENKICTEICSILKRPIHPRASQKGLRDPYTKNWPNTMEYIFSVSTYRHSKVTHITPKYN